VEMVKTTERSGDLLVFRYSQEDFQSIATLLKRETGISLGKTKNAFVYSRLTKRLRSLGLDDFKHYCVLVESERGAAERREMIAALTTNVTKFFREPHHFEHLAGELDRLAPQVRAGGRLRIWSAACSNGQEAFSIAMTIYGALPDADALDVKVLGTDIDVNMIAAARLAEYHEEAVAAIPSDLREKWLCRSSRREHWRMNERLSSLVTFRELNLIRPWPMKRKFDAIFCRNVAIYFDDRTQQEMWRRFVPALATGGVLYIGHSERVSGPALHHLVGDGVTTYRLTTGGHP
jgi:chemotaxis protein methyltransferase CheR